ncbi:Ig-like domain-containing protein [Pseudomonadota bacterium]
MESTFITDNPIDGSFIVNSEFGERYKPDGGSGCLVDTQLHSGIDLRTIHIVPVTGQAPLLSAHDGEIIKCGWSPSMGNYIVIRDPITKKGTLYAHLHEIRLTVDDTEYLFGKYYEDPPGAWHDQVNYIVQGKVYLDGVEQVDEEVIVASGEQIGLCGDTPSVVPHLHMEVLNEDGTQKVKDQIAPIGIGFVTGMDGGKYLENPRLHFAKAFPLEFPLSVSGYTCGIELESDDRDNTLTGNARDNIFILHGGHNIIVDPTPETGRIFVVIDDLRKEISGQASFITDEYGLVPYHETGLQRYFLSGHILQRVDGTTGVPSSTGTDLRIAVEGSPYRTVTVKDFDFSEDATTLGIGVPVYREVETVSDVGSVGHIKTERLKDGSGFSSLYCGSYKVHLDTFSSSGQRLHHTELAYCSSSTCANGPSPNMLALANGNVAVSTAGYLEEVFVVNTKTGGTTELDLYTDFGFSIGLGTELVVMEADSDEYFYIVLVQQGQGVKRIKYDQDGDKVGDMEFLDMDAYMKAENPSWEFGLNSVSPIQGGKGSFILHYCHSTASPDFARLISSSFDVSDTDLRAILGSEFSDSRMRQHSIVTTSGKILYINRSNGRLYVINPDGSYDRTVQLDSNAPNAVIRESDTPGVYYVTYRAYDSGYVYGIQRVDENGYLIGNRTNNPYLDNASNYNIMPMEDGSVFFIEGYPGYYKISTLYPSLEFGPATKQTVCQIEEVSEETLTASYNPAAPYKPVVLSSATEYATLDGGDAMVVEMYPGYGETTMISSSALGSRTIMHGGSGTNIYMIQSVEEYMDDIEPTTPSIIEIRGAELGTDRVNITSIHQGPHPALTSDIIGSIKPYNGTSTDGTIITNGTCLTIDEDGNFIPSDVDTTSMTNLTRIIFSDKTPEELSHDSVITSLFSPVNHNPVIDEEQEILDITIPENEEHQLDILLCQGITDPDGHEISVYSIEDEASGHIILGDEDEVIDTPHGQIYYDATNGTIIYEPDTDYEGPDSFNVTYTDKHGGYVTRPVHMEMTHTNERPVIDQEELDDSDLTITEDDEFDFGLRPYIHDSDTDPRNISCIYHNTTTFPLGVIPHPNCSIYGRPAPGTAGNYSLPFQAYDGSDYSDIGFLPMGIRPRQVTPPSTNNNILPISLIGGGIALLLGGMIVGGVWLYKKFWGEETESEDHIERGRKKELSEEEQRRKSRREHHDDIELMPSAVDSGIRTRAKRDEMPYDDEEIEIPDEEERRKRERSSENLLPSPDVTSVGVDGSSRV